MMQARAHSQLEVLELFLNKEASWNSERLSSRHLRKTDHPASLRRPGAVADARKVRRSAQIFAMQGERFALWRHGSEILPIDILVRSRILSLCSPH